MFSKVHFFVPAAIILFGASFSLLYFCSRSLFVGDNSTESAPKKFNLHIPKFMLEIYEQNKGEKDFSTPDVVRSLIPSTSTTEIPESNDVIEEFSDNHILVFDLPMSSKDENFISAELKIFTEVQLNSSVQSGVKKLLKISIYNNTIKSFTNLEETKIHHFHNSWLTFNLTNEVGIILKTNFTTNKQLKISLTVSSIHRYSKNNLKLSIKPKTENIDHNYPVLLLFYSLKEKNPVYNKIHVRKHKTFDFDEKKFAEKGRIKRNLHEIADYDEETNQIWNDLTSGNGLSVLDRGTRNNCRRKPLYINFAEIDYDLWIIQPPGYEAYQCHGRCFYPVAQHLSPTKHAIMQALLHSVSPLKASRSCCVPTVLDSMSILYVDDKGILTYRYAYKDMVVAECGCR